MSGIGHNMGPTMEPGAAWRRHCWKKARTDLLPRMPLEVIRMRMRRARQLGLAFPAYNRIRTTTGRDIVAFLFSSNALRVDPVQITVPKPVADHLIAQKGCQRLVAAHPPLVPKAVAEGLAGQGVDVRTVMTAPGLTHSFSQTRTQIRRTLNGAGVPGDGVVLVAATTQEREWLVAGNLAGLVSADAFFAPQTT